MSAHGEFNVSALLHLVEIKTVYVPTEGIVVERGMHTWKIEIKKQHNITKLGLL